MHVVPLRLSRADDGCETFLQSGGREGGNLDGALVNGATALAVDGRRRDDGGADSLGVCGENDLVNIAVQSVVREVQEAVNVADVVVFLVWDRGLPETFMFRVILWSNCQAFWGNRYGRTGVLGIYPLQNARAGYVYPKTRPLRRMSLREALSNGFGGRLVISRVGSI